MWVYDRETLAFLEVNAAAVEQYGYSRDEFRTMTLKDIRPAEDHARLAKDVETARPALQHSGFWRHKLKDGRIITVEITSHTIALEGKAAVLVMSQDVTERTRSARRLTEAEALYHRTLDTMMEGVQILDSGLTYLYVNESAARHGRRRQAEFIGRKMTELYPGIDATPMFRQLHTCLTTGEPQSIENLFEYRDGDTAWFELRVQKVPEGIFILSIDITSRKLAEKQLAQMKRLYATLSQVNQTIVRSRNREDLFDSIVDVSARFGEFALAWIGMVDYASGDLVPAAAHGADIGDWPFQRVNIHQDSATSGLVARAVMSGKVVTSEDLRVDPRVESSRPLIHQFNYRSSAAVPFHLHGRAVGCLALVSTREGHFASQEEVSLLEEIGLDISFALENLETERVKQQWADAFTHCAHGLAIGLPGSETILTCNEAFARSQGCVIDDVVGTPIADMYPPFEKQRIREKIAEADRNGFVRFEAARSRKDGSTYPVQLDLVSVRNEKGELLYRVATQQDITERVRNEAAISESNRQLSALVGSLDDIVFEFDEACRYVNVWAADERLLAKPRAALIGKTIVDVLGEEAGRPFENAIAKVLALGVPETLEYRLESLDGPHWFSARISAIANTANQRTSACMLVRDISDRKIAEEELYKSERALKLFVEFAPAAIAMFDRDMRYIAVSQRFIRDYRLEGKEVVGLSHYRVFPEIPERWKEIHRRCLAGAIERSGDDPFPRADGTLDWVRWEIHPWYERVGEVGGIILFSELTTEQKLAERAVRESEERFRNLFEAALDAILVADQQTGRFVAANPAAAKLYGYTQSELLQMTVADISAEPEKSQAAVRDLVRYVSQRMHRRRNGEEFPVEISGSYFTLGGRTLHTAFIRDITERRRAEESLRASESRFATMFNSSPLAIALTNLTSRTLVDVNPAWLELAGLTREEAVAQDPVALDLWFDPARREELLVLMQSRGRVNGFEIAMRRRSGDTLDILMSAEWVEMNGEPCMLTIAQDITDRKRSEAQIRKLNRVYAVLSNINQAIVRIHEPDVLFHEACRIAVADGGFLHAWLGKLDRGTMQVDVLADAGTGTQGEVVQQKSMTRSLGFPPGIAAAVLQRQFFIASEPSTITSLREWTEGGITATVRSVGVFPLVVSDQIYGVLTLLAADPDFFDVDEVKLLEELAMDISFAVRFIQQEEDARKALVARQNLEAQLHQAQKLESLGTLASGIAHDFNNLLGIMIGHAALVEQSPADPALAQKSAQAILKAGTRGTGLVKQMLTFARKADVTIDAINLNDVVEDILKLLQETLPKTIVVSSDLEPQLPPVEADTTHMHQVLLNLCVNARDAMIDGGTLRVRTHRESGEVVRVKLPDARAREYVVVTVSDTGMGMDQDTQRRIFEPFFTTKERGKGTGLGLSMVFGIMESHHGFVTVDSSPGHGASFTCYFPVPEVLEKRNEQSLPPIEPGVAAAGTILVVEDEELLRDLLRMYLEGAGFTVIAASDAMDGLSEYQKRHTEIDVVLSDLGLPKFGGDELYRRMKAINPNVRMVLASGYIEPGMKSRILSEGVREFIQKPYRPDEVLRSIRLVLRL
jgi:PAS domain S-box-containing protein